MIEQVRVRKWTWAGRVSTITNGHYITPPGNPTKGKVIEEGRRDGGATNKTTTEMHCFYYIIPQDNIDVYKFVCITLYFLNWNVQ